MIIGIGTDLVDITRIENALDRHGDRFEQRCFTKAEQTKAKNRSDKKAQAQTYAKRFAAKEACVKALGTGFDQGITMRDIGVIEDAYGKPSLELSGTASQKLLNLIPDGFSPVLHLSLTDEFPYAQAFVIIEAR